MTSPRPVLAMLLLAAPLAAQDARLRSRLDPETLGGVQVLLDSARSAGLPTEPLILKALEGRSKNASGDRIVGAVRLMLGSLRESRLALGPEAGAGELSAGATALRAGAEAATLSMLRRQRGREVTVPLSVLTDLVARGVTVASASRAVNAMVHQGLSDREFLQLRNQIEDDIRGGTTPGAALDRRIAGLPAAAPPRRP